MTDDTPAISDLTLERYQLDELDARDRAAIETRAALDPALRRRLDDLAQSTREIRERGLIGSLIQSVGDAPRSPRRWHWSVAAAAAGIALVAVMWQPAARDRVQTSTTERIKGERASLLLYRRTDTGSEALDDGAIVREGDLIRVAYRSGDPCFGVIISIDGAGVVTRHHPSEAPAAAALTLGSPTPLDSAYELDDAPGWERFFLVTADQSFEVEAVMRAARQTAALAAPDPPSALPLPAGFHQSSFLLRKAF